MAVYKARSCIHGGETVGLRWEEPGPPCTVISQCSQSLLRSCESLGNQACLPQPQPLGCFLGPRKARCQIHSNFVAPGTCLPLSSGAVNSPRGHCHPIILPEFGGESQSTPGHTSSYLGSWSRKGFPSLRVCGPDPHPSLCWIPGPHTPGLWLEKPTFSNPSAK